MPQKIDRTGETNRAKNGMLMTIIAYRNSADMDIQFEDGAITAHKLYDCFKKGTIKHPNQKSAVSKILIDRNKELSKERSKKLAENRIHETNIAKNGLRMEIIAYRKADDIDIKFEDGTIVEHKEYKRFKQGSIQHPTISGHLKSRIGESNMANCGMMMTITGYRNKLDIDVTFENGITVYNRKYSAFKDGSICYPEMIKEIRADIYKKQKENTARKYLHQKRQNKMGVWMTITDVRSSVDIDIEFETGCKVTNKTIYNFLHYSMQHPLPYQMNDIIMDKFAYVYNDIGQFYCHCTKCDMIDIMSINEMKNHKCKNY